MEISATFHISILFLTVLIFSRCFATFAPRNSGRIDVETVPAENETAVHLEVKVEAEQDARRDINKLFWLGAGVGIFSLASFMGISGCLVGIAIFPAENSLGFMPMIDFSTEAIVIACISFVSGILIPCIGIHRAGVNPPSDRFLEKPPEYVESYSDTYLSKTRSLRLRWAIVGIVVLGYVVESTRKLTTTRY